MAWTATDCTVPIMSEVSSNACGLSGPDMGDLDFAEHGSG
jgi:hypothetical protein